MLEKLFYFLGIIGKKLETVIGRVLSSVIFFLLYFIAIGIYALFFFLINGLKNKKIPSSLWRDKAPRLITLKNMEKQF